MIISLNLIATNKYLMFVPEILKSVEKYFFLQEEIHVIIHTNLDINDIFPSKKRITIFKNDVKYEPWPFNTLNRFHYFLETRDLIKKSDYSFYVDVDSLFIGSFGLSDINKSGIFATIHPCLNQGPGTPERNDLSEAYIPYGATNRYFCGGFFGGSSDHFLRMSEKIKEAIDKDLEKNIIAIWHDESHLNKYLYLNKPSTIFDFPFAIAENINPQFENSKVKFLDKKILGGHVYLRN